MANAMRIDIAVGGVSLAGNAFRQVAAGGQVLVDLQQQIVSGYGTVAAAAKQAIPLPSTQVAPRLEAIAEGLQNVAAGYELVKQAQAGVDFKAPAVPAQRQRIRVQDLHQPAAGGAADPAQQAPAVRVPVGPEQRVARLEKALEEAKKGGDETQIADTQAALSRALEQRDRQRGSAGAGVVEQARRSRISRGPRELLGEIDQELEAPDLGDARKGDLLDRQFRAQRSIILNERRRATPDESLNRPGLLELFGDLNSILGDIRGGDIGGAMKKTHQLGFRIMPQNAPGTNEREGGLNIEQMLGQGGSGRFMIGGPKPAPVLPVAPTAPSLSDFAGIPAVGASAGRAAGMLAKLAPVAAAAAPVLLGVAAAGAAAVVGFHALNDAVQTAVTTLGEMRRAVTASGGSAEEVTRIRAFGVGAGEIAGIGQQLRDRLNLANANPYAMMAGARAGVGPQMSIEMGGDPDNARITLQVFEYLRALGEEGKVREQLIEATRLGVVAQLDFINVSKQVHQARLLDAEVSRRVLELNGQATRDMSAEQLRLAENTAQLKAAITGPYMADFAAVVGFAADGVRTLTHVLTEWGGAIKTVAMILDPTKILLANDTVRRFREQIAGGAKPEAKGGEKQQSAVERNTAALNELNGTLEGLKPGFTGGGARAEGSMPSALRGEALRRAYRDKAMRRKQVVL